MRERESQRANMLNEIDVCQRKEAYPCLDAAIRLRNAKYFKTIRDGAAQH
jgi:hypothetical protein